MKREALNHEDEKEQQKNWGLLDRNAPKIEWQEHSIFGKYQCFILKYGSRHIFGRHLNQNDSKHLINAPMLIGDLVGLDKNHWHITPISLEEAAFIIHHIDLHKDEIYYPALSLNQAIEIPSLPYGMDQEDEYINNRISYWQEKNSLVYFMSVFHECHHEEFKWVSQSKEEQLPERLLLCHAYTHIQKNYPRQADVIAVKSIPSGHTTNHPILEDIYKQTKHRGRIILYNQAARSTALHSWIKSKQMIALQKIGRDRHGIFPCYVLCKLNLD
jgi:hypothetical protein